MENQSWQSLPYVTKTFFELSHPNAVLTESPYSSLGRFVIIMYDKTSSKVDVNKLRKHLFTKSTTSMDRLPPTRDALNLHIKRVYLQTQIWASSLPNKIDFKKPDDFGWRKKQRRIMVSALVRFTRSCSILSGTCKLWLQERMCQEMQLQEKFTSLF